MGFKQVFNRTPYTNTTQHTFFARVPTVLACFAQDFEPVPRNLSERTGPF